MFSHHRHQHHHHNYHHHHHHHHHDHLDQNKPQDARTRFNLEIWCFRSSELQSKAICGGKPQKLGNKCQRWQRYLRSTDLQLVRSDVVRCDFVIWMYVIYLRVSVCDCVLFSVCDCVWFSVCVFACLCLYEHLFVEHMKVLLCLCNVQTSLVNTMAKLERVKFNPLTHYYHHHCHCQVQPSDREAT